MHYLLFYEVGEDYVSRRAAFRDSHLERAWKACARGELMLAGALANPVDGAMLLFQGDSPEVAEKFAKADPYVTNGLVKRWYVREWTTVAGEEASTPVRPSTAAAREGSQSQSATSADKSPSSRGQGRLVLRMWKARSTADKLSAYVRHVTGKVFPSLRAIEGHRGAYLARRTVNGAIELIVLTLWDSMAAIRKFAGAEPGKAVVDPEAKAALTEFDDFVTHFEVIHSTVEGNKLQA